MTKRVNIQLSSELHTKAKILAVLSNETLNDYLARAIDERIKKDDAIIKKLGKQ